MPQDAHPRLASGRCRDPAVRRRRRFAARVAPIALGLVVLGVAFVDHGGTVGTLGLVALSQGVGLAVAILWLAAGRNPLSRD